MQVKEWQKVLNQFGSLPKLLLWIERHLPAGFPVERLQSTADVASLVKPGSSCSIFISHGVRLPSVYRVSLRVNARKYTFSHTYSVQYNLAEVLRLSEPNIKLEVLWASGLRPSCP